MLSSRYFTSNAPTVTAKQLYKQLFRECDKLPKEPRQFYKFTVRQSYKQHVSESDPERIQQIISRALEDSKWIAQKYSKKQEGGHNKLDSKI